MERQAEGPLSFYQRFLRITFYTFRCSCARACARAHQHVSVYAAKYTYTRRSLSFLSSPSSPSTSCPILLHPPCRSPSASPHRSALPSSSSSLLYVRVRTRICVYVCTCALSQSLYARFHVARLYAPAARGRLYTWVNGKMSFETFLGRSRSPHCQSYAREIPLSRKRSPPRVVPSTMPVASR